MRKIEDWEGMKEEAEKWRGLTDEERTFILKSVQKNKIKVSYLWPNGKRNRRK